MSINEKIKNSGLRVKEAPLEVIKTVWQEWGEPVVSIGKLYKSSDVKGLVLLSPENETLGLVTYAFDGDRAEIVTLNALVKGKGYGTLLLAYAEEVVVSAGAKRIRIITSNDNYRALSLYIKSGYRLINVHLNEMDNVRRIKPYVPLMSEEGLPILDRLELEKIITVE